MTLCSPRYSQESSPTPVFENINSLALGLFYAPTLTSIHDHWKNHSFDYMDIAGKVMSLLFSILSRFVIAFLPRSKRLLISWLQSLSSVILEPKEIKSSTQHSPLNYMLDPYIRPLELIFQMPLWEPSHLTLTL